MVNLLVQLIKPKSGMRIYDHTCGSGGMLIQSKKYLIENNDDPRNISLYGQEDNLGTWAICKINMFFCTTNFVLKLIRTERINLIIFIIL